MHFIFFFFLLRMVLGIDILDTLDQSLKEIRNQSVIFYSSFHTLLFSSHLYLHFLMDLILLKGDTGKLPQLSCTRHSRYRDAKVQSPMCRSDKLIEMVLIFVVKIRFLLCNVESEY